MMAQRAMMTKAAMTKTSSSTEFFFHIGGIKVQLVEGCKTDGCKRDVHMAWDLAERSEAH
jgi:hypothetical protein